MVTKMTPNGNHDDSPNFGSLLECGICEHLMICLFAVLLPWKDLHPHPHPDISVKNNSMIVSRLGMSIIFSVFYTDKHNSCVYFFVEVYPKEITTIGEQMFSLYSPTRSHFCSFTFHDVADHLPVFQPKSKVIKYPEKNCLLVPRCLPVTTMPQFVT